MPLLIYTVFTQDSGDLRIACQLQFIRYETFHVRGPPPPHFGCPVLCW